MDDAQKKSMRRSLRETYDKYAQEREGGGIADWKVQERALFLSMLQQQQKKTLLEIGAGPGRDSRFFQDEGFEVTCIDLSPAMVELCRQKGLKAYVMDMTDIQLPDGAFDAVFAMNSLLHLPKAEFPLVLRGVDRLLKPNGLFYLGVYGGFEQEGVWEQDRYEPKRFFSFFTDTRIEQEVAKVFDVVSFRQIATEGESDLHFQSLILRKRSAASASPSTK